MTALLKPVLRRIDFGTPLKDTASLSLDFARQEYYKQGVSSTFPSIVTFTRASTGTHFDATGKLVSAAIGAPRFDYDPVTLQPRGLLVEESRTNLLTYSEQFDNGAWVKQSVTITQNATTSPDGTVNADKMVSAVGSTLGVYQFPAGYALNVDHTISVFAKAAEFSMLELSWNGNGSAVFNLATGALVSGPAEARISSVGNGWYRCSTVAQRSSAGQALTIKFGPTEQAIGNGTSGIYVWGAQLDAGAFPTSYIPTVASQVTRSADVATVNTLSPWYNAVEGALFVECSAIGVPPNAGTSASLTDSAADNRILVGQYFTTTRIGSVGVSNVDQAVLSVPAVPVGVSHKFAMSWKQDNFAGCADGGTVLTDSSGSIPTVTKLNIGALNTEQRFSGHIRAIRYYPRKLANSELQAITV